MEFLVYRSRALVAPGTAEADSIVTASLCANARRGVTGFLHHEPQLFVHYLEGPSDALHDVWRRILADPRHCDATVLASAPMLRRLFGGWHMGYSDGRVAWFADFLDAAAGKSLADQATAREAIWFLRGACQRLDLGLTA